MMKRAGVAAVLALGGLVAPACQETTTTPELLAIRCAATPSSGTAPLSVAFALDVANAVGTFSVSISYGDGTQGNDPDVRYVYAAAGEYVASITVSAGAEMARCSVPISVAPSPQPVPSPAAAENRWPEASFRTTPPASGTSITGKAPLTVQYNMCRSVDPDGDRLVFRMDLDGDGAFEYFGASGADCRHEATYAVGTRTATICVTDVDCPGWPLCEDLARVRYHPYQCASYTVTATP